MGCKTHDLGEVERIVADGIENKVLQFVDRVQQVFPESGHCWVDKGTGSPAGLLRKQSKNETATRDA